ncbi:hypothetical protein EXIGLDRAFT_583908, partial [Exidia glandulosa HHB12029]
LLELISIHSLNVAPNVTAWASTLETFWYRRGYTVAEKRVFRTRLGNALHWYQVVKNQMEAAVSRAAGDNETSVDTHASPSGDTSSSDARGTHEPATTNEGASSDDNQYNARRRPAGGRPAEYLRERCPLCFGGPRPIGAYFLLRSHVIVCLDANFSQKRRRSNYTDPALSYENSRFVDPCDVERMEKEVEEKRSKVTRKRKKGTSAKLDDAVLDECEHSFLAAQEKVTKASKNYYADTGLMAILCRHDQVL